MLGLADVFLTVTCVPPLAWLRAAAWAAARVSGVDGGVPEVPLAVAVAVLFALAVEFGVFVVFVEEDGWAVDADVPVAARVGLFVAMAAWAAAALAWVGCWRFSCPPARPEISADVG
jgi:hypothetical protein